MLCITYGQECTQSAATRRINQEIELVNCFLLTPLHSVYRQHHLVWVFVWYLVQGSQDIHVHVLSSGFKCTSTILWEMFIVKIFSWGRRTTRTKCMNICVYSIHFVCLIIVGCHEPQKYFNPKILHTKIFHTNFSQATVVQYWVASNLKSEEENKIPSHDGNQP